uniref:Protein scarlet n=1 Tax=Cacopsylla melanoneura TaxID=428564 RepID=A0A8D8PZS8_9HEMI
MIQFYVTHLLELYNLCSTPALTSRGSCGLQELDFSRHITSANNECYYYSFEDNLIMKDNIALSWENVCLYAPPKAAEGGSIFSRKKPSGISGKVKLLNNVSGIAVSGTLTAIMGPSGAGKTTLLTTISQRTTGDFSGKLLLNGHLIDRNLMSRISGFVAQNDVAFGGLTVKEHLEFMARLKMDKRTSAQSRRCIVATLVQDLGLAKCYNTRLAMLSGGEKKRVSLATQMLTDPPFLFCDEPTTGLDSYSAGTVVAVLRSFTQRGKAVLCTIHQPASGIFELFDRVILMVPGGRVAYQGPVHDSLEHFKKLNMHCPPAYNTAEFLIKQLAQPSQKIDWLVKQFEKSSSYSDVTREIENIAKKNQNMERVFGIEEMFLKFYSMQPPSSTTQLSWLIWRTGLTQIRNLRIIGLRLIMYMFTGVLIASPYMSSSTLDQTSIQNLQGFFYSCISETVFTHTYSVLYTFPAEIPILLREVDQQVYKPKSYYLSKVIVLLPKTIIETFLFSSVVFWISGLNTGALGFASFITPITVAAVTSTAYGFCVSAMFESLATASLLSVPLDFVSYVFSGIFIHLGSLPTYTFWLKYLSRFYYATEAISILQWSQVENIACPENFNSTCITTGAGVLRKYGYHRDSLGLDFVGLIVMYFVLHYIGYTFLKKRSRNRAVY